MNTKTSENVLLKRKELKKGTQLLQNEIVFVSGDLSKVIVELV